MLKLDSIFTSNMVFAVNKPVLVYGTGEGIAKITFNGKTVTATVNDGNWIAQFEPMSYGGPYTLAADLDGEKITLNNVYVGNVYHFAGQSNMQDELEDTTYPVSEYQSCDMLRLFYDEKLPAEFNPYGKNHWLSANKDKIGKWSALAYVAGLDVAKQKNIAVGIVTSYHGASVIESWLPEGALDGTGINLPLSDKAKYHTYPTNADGYWYTAQFSKKLPFNVNAIVWYQGESDTSEAEGRVYKKELALLVERWRKDYNDAKLPVLIVQIADNIERGTVGWKLVQRAQYEIQFELDNVKTVISADVCENDNIHPPTKHKLAHRIATALLEL